MEVPVPRAGRGGVTASSCISSHCSRPASGNSPGRRAARAAREAEEAGLLCAQRSAAFGSSSQVAPPGLPSLRSLARPAALRIWGPNLSTRK